MRKIKFIVVHCTDTLPTVTLEAIKGYWKNQLKEERPLCHYMIKPDGEIVRLLEEEKVANGVFGYNEQCLSLSYIGGKNKDGKPADTRTDAQKAAMFDLIVELSEKHPGAEIKGHGEFSDHGGTTCPNFNVRGWLKDYTPDVDEEDLETAA